MKKEIGNQKPCKKKICVSPNRSGRTFYNSMPMEIIAKWGATKDRPHDIGVLVSCCVFIEMYLK